MFGIFGVMCMAMLQHRRFLEHSLGSFAAHGLKTVMRIRTKSHRPNTSCLRIVFLATSSTPHVAHKLPQIFLAADVFPRLSVVPQPLVTSSFNSIRSHC